MVIDILKQNLNQIGEIIREIYVFTNQLEIIQRLEKESNVVINNEEKNLIKKSIDSLLIQLRILNDSIPELVNNIKFFKRLGTDKEYKKFVKKSIQKERVKKFLVKIQYQPTKDRKKISVIINNKDKREFLENLSKSNFSINQLKAKYSIRKPIVTDFGKSNIYARISNHFYRNFSNKLLAKGYLGSLNRNLRKINSRFVVGTYASMIFFTMTLFVIISLLFLTLLLFYNINFTYPNLMPTEESVLVRLIKYFWVVFLIPVVVGGIMYIYPKSEAKNIGKRIQQELPFVTIHMSAIAISGVEPIKIFEIIVKSEEYPNTRMLFRRFLNLINFHGYDLVTALAKTSQVCPSIKLRELLNSMATTITSGGSLANFLSQHSETLLFDYRLEREKYIKTAETFMDIYISIVIAAPMILLILFVIMGSTGLYFLGLTPDIMGILIILIIIFLNFGFLIFLKLKQPIF